MIEPTETVVQPTRGKGKKTKASAEEVPIKSEVEEPAVPTKRRGRPRAPLQPDSSSEQQLVEEPFKKPAPKRGGKGKTAVEEDEKENAGLEVVSERKGRVTKKVSPVAEPAVEVATMTSRRTRTKR